MTPIPLMKLSRKISGGELDDRYPIRAGFARRCARAASGQAVAAPPISDMNSRRLMPNIGRSSRLGAWSACRTLNLRQSDQQVLGIDLNCSESTEALLAHVLPVSKIAHTTVAYETAALRNFDPANVADGSKADLGPGARDVGLILAIRHRRSDSLGPRRPKPDRTAPFDRVYRRLPH